METPVEERYELARGQDLPREDWRTLARTGGYPTPALDSEEDRAVIEVKATSVPGPRDARGLVAFREEYPGRFLGGLLLHDGDEVPWISDRVLAAPWHKVV